MQPSHHCCARLVAKEGFLQRGLSLREVDGTLQQGEPRNLHYAGPIALHTISHCVTDEVLLMHTCGQLAQDLLHQLWLHGHRPDSGLTTQRLDRAGTTGLFLYYEQSARLKESGGRLRAAGRKQPLRTCVLKVRTGIARINAVAYLDTRVPRRNRQTDASYCHDA